MWGIITNEEEAFKNNELFTFKIRIASIVSTSSLPKYSRNLFTTTALINSLFSPPISLSPGINTV